MTELYRRNLTKNSRRPHKEVLLVDLSVGIVLAALVALLVYMLVAD